MDYSFQAIYGNYLRFCQVIQQPKDSVLSFEDWMVKRDGEAPKDKTREFLQTLEV